MRADLTELEIDVLIAAVEGEEPRIQAYRSGGADDCAIKAGKERIVGDAAIAAVHRLRRAGFVEKVEDASFVLTPDGLQVASALHQQRRS